MEFSLKKLPQRAAPQLRSCSIGSVRPYAPMLAPIYVLMRRNEKFVSVKGPLDFFLPEELKRLASFETFFFPEFVEAVIPFQQAGRAVRAILGWNPSDKDAIPPAPYELSDMALRIVGPLWGLGERNQLLIEPYFPAVFADELCDPLDSRALVEARERSVETYERAIVCSGWAVFLAVHLGYCSLDALSELRAEIFDGIVTGEIPRECSPGLSERDEIAALACGSLNRLEAVSSEFFEGRSERVSLKLVSRIRRVRSEFVRSGVLPTIFGERGFVDV